MSYPRNLQYAILAKSEWDHTTERLQDCPGVLIVDVMHLGHHVQEATGRAHVLANGNVGRKLREGKRVYVAGNSATGHSDLLVQKVTP